ncbi:MAG: metal ABC transporter permease [Acidobacteria bacterium]|uniref:Metal ABC transporter permease n=1 Tax=Candidatus Polarisedimenticola svalbardensis TaxID=2886004 RepID=A0A8J6Y0C0_9BACT|nr:metal ABC transporter permease [Candidatus Polarisedimenticola svalbardensis]
MEWTFTVRIVLAGSALLGLTGGVLGCFALLRRQSLLSDALAHAALPGVCLAFLITGSKSPEVLLAGAMVAGVLGAFAILAVIRNSRIKEDSAIGIILSVFFGAGIVLLTWIQKLPAGNQSGLDRFLFGQAATMGTDDIRLLSVVAVLVLCAVVLFFKEFKLVSFDQGFGVSLGLPVKLLEFGLTALLVLVVVIGLQMVGVVLMVATLVTPAAAARQWTDRLGLMLLLSGGIGAVSGSVGALASATLPRVPTGPAIVLVSSVILVFSLMLAPRRGMVWAMLQDRQVERRIRRENLLKDLYLAGERGTGFTSWVTLPILMGYRGLTGAGLLRSARRLVKNSHLERSGDQLRLTVEGIREAAKVVRKHRLWESYLSRRLELPPDHLHRDAEMMEHALSDEVVDDLDRRLGYPECDPHGKPIPREQS